MTADPLVSVTIPVRNGERFIRQALDSVLAQSYRPIEVIVVDDGSADATSEIVRQYGSAVRYLYQDHMGLPAGRNRGIAAANGEILAFLAHDDLYTPEKLEIQVGYLVAHPDIQYTVSHIKFFLEPGCGIPRGFRPELLEGSHPGRIPEALVARKSLFAAVGLFRTDLKIADDVDWFARCKDQHIQMAVLPQVLLHKRVHDTNLSSNAMANNRELLTLLRDSIRRQSVPVSPSSRENTQKEGDR
jgi:glycosyltransferase involved in cell wall biosynthesis